MADGLNGTGVARWSPSAWFRRSGAAAAAQPNGKTDLRGAHARAQAAGRQQASGPQTSVRARSCAVGAAPPGGTTLQQLRLAALAGITDAQERKFIELQLQFHSPLGASPAQLQADVIALAASPRADELVVRHLGDGLRRLGDGKDAADPAPAQALSQTQQTWLAEGVTPAFVERQPKSPQRQALQRDFDAGWVSKGALQMRDKDGKLSGGKSGSKQVKTALGTMQQKFSVSAWSRFTKQKTAGPHTDNFAEVIGSRLARGLAGAGREKLLPTVSLVYDDKRQALEVASKYLAEPGQCGDLDKMHKDAGGTRDPRTHHVRVDLRAPPVGTTPPSSVMHMTDPQMVADLCDNIALSVFLDDADMNPGNMMGLQVDGRQRLGRIDFGHAFADLVFAPRRFGGGRDATANVILDAFNREKVGGSKVGGSPNKIWRNYIGVMPSQQMADALKRLADRVDGKALAQAMADARAPFDAMVRSLAGGKSDATRTLADDARDSLAAIGRRQGLTLRSTDLAGMVDELFAGLTAVMQQRGAQMAHVAKLAQLQVDIDQFIDTSRQDAKHGVPDLPEAIETAYKQLCGDKRSIEWLKCSREVPAFKGDLPGYIAWRIRQTAVAQSPEP